MATAEQLAAVMAQSRATLQDATAIEIVRLRRIIAAQRDLARGIAARAWPMATGYAIRDDDMQALRDMAEAAE